MRTGNFVLNHHVDSWRLQELGTGVLCLNSNSSNEKLRTTVKGCRQSPEGLEKHIDRNVLVRIARGVHAREARLMVVPMI